MAYDDGHDKLWEIIKKTKFAMLTHRHGDGHLHSQPLTTQNKSLDEGATLYFFVARDGDIVRHLASDANVNLAYANVDDDDYVSVSGVASVSEDSAKKEELFNTLAKAWFPGGAADPNLALLAVSIRQAEYWKATDSKLVQLVKMATAAVTGNPPSGISEHKKVS